MTISRHKLKDSVKWITESNQVALKMLRDGGDPDNPADIEQVQLEFQTVISKVINEAIAVLEELIPGERAIREGRSFNLAKTNAERFNFFFSYNGDSTLHELVQKAGELAIDTLIQEFDEELSILLTLCGCIYGIAIVTLLLMIPMMRMVLHCSH
jgi:hypothetical protein